MTTVTFTLDPDELDELIATELRRCYKDLATADIKWPEREPTMEAILVILGHYMTEPEFGAWKQSIGV